MQETFKSAPHAHMDFLVVAMAAIELKAGLEDVQIELRQEIQRQGTEQT
jgi:hypothetical protein